MALSDERLKEISLEKTKNGNATSKALAAQRELWERAGCPFDGFHHDYTLDNRMFEDDYVYEEHTIVNKTR